MSKLGRFSRTELLLGEVGMEKLANSTVGPRLAVPLASKMLRWARVT